MKKDKDYDIIVNAEEKVVEDANVTFDQIVELAFPGHPNDPNVLYSITFEHAKDPKQGTLAPGGTVEVKNHGTIFDVTQTNRS